MNNQSVTGLAALEEQIRRDLAYLNYPATEWSIGTDRVSSDVLDVVIIGAGMSGVAAAFALKQKGISAPIFDSAAPGEEGPWKTPALMETLRSPKHVVGPATASPSLSFQAWFRAQFGDEKWEELDKIPRLQWAEYLHWFQKMTAPEVFNRHTLTDIIPTAGGTELIFSTPAGKKQLTARHVILATGMESFSEPNIPDFVDGIPESFWEHAYAGSDYSRFKGLDIAVVGYSAGAMDSAATALEHGARSAELLIRAPDMPRVNRGKVAGSAGFLEAYRHFSDAQKWHYFHYVTAAKTPSPRGSTLRVSRHDNAFFNFNSPVEKVTVKEKKLHINTPQGTVIADYLILATGYRINWQKNDAFRRIAPHIKTWADAYTPPPGEEEAALSRLPYLGENFELLPKNNEAPEGLERIYSFNLSGSVSMGPLIGLIPGTGDGALKLAGSIAAKLYLSRFDEHMQAIRDSTFYELEGDEWTPAIPYKQRFHGEEAG